MILFEMKRRKNNMICFDLVLEVNFEVLEILFDDDDLKIFFQVCDEVRDDLAHDLNLI